MGAAGPAARREEGEYSAYLTDEQRSRRAGSARFGDGRLSPRAARPRPRYGALARVNEPAPESGTKPRILIVDDEPSLRDMLRIVLRRDGFDVLLAANGREAIAVLEKERVDLLLSDIRMPDVGGVDVLRAAKALNRDIIAFMMTAFASTDSAVEAMRLGAVDYFTKPFNMDELRLKVRQHLEARARRCCCRAGRARDPGRASRGPNGWTCT